MRGLQRPSRGTREQPNAQKRETRPVVEDLTIHRTTGQTEHSEWNPRVLLTAGKPEATRSVFLPTHSTHRWLRTIQDSVKRLGPNRGRDGKRPTNLLWEKSGGKQGENTCVLLTPPVPETPRRHQRHRGPLINSTQRAHLKLSILQKKMTRSRQQHVPG